MKKIHKAIAFYFSVLFITVVLQSCCNDSFRIIGAGTITAYDLETLSSTNEITGTFSISQIHEVELVHVENFSLVNSAMALSCDYAFDNPLIADEIKISFDKDFTYKGTVIEANSDFSQLEDIQLLGWEGTIEIIFPAEFIDNIEFDNDTYTFKITSKTVDEQEFESSIGLIMNF